MQPQWRLLANSIQHRQPDSPSHRMNAQNKRWDSEPSRSEPTFSSRFRKPPRITMHSVNRHSSSWSETPPNQRHCCVFAPSLIRSSTSTISSTRQTRKGPKVVSGMGRIQRREGVMRQPIRTFPHTTLGGEDTDAASEGQLR
jgi:hypothetical protein